MWSLVGTFRELTLSESTVHMDIVMKTSMVRDIVHAQMPGHPTNVQIIHKCTCFLPTTIFFSLPSPWRKRKVLILIESLYLQEVLKYKLVKYPLIFKTMSCFEMLTTDCCAVRNGGLSCH